MIKNRKPAFPAQCRDPRTTAAVALFMLAILFGLSATDYRTRLDEPAPWQMPRQLSGAHWGQDSW